MNNRRQWRCHFIINICYYTIYFNQIDVVCTWKQSCYIINHFLSMYICIHKCTRHKKLFFLFPCVQANLFPFVPFVLFSLSLSLWSYSLSITHIILSTPLFFFWSIWIGYNHFIAEFPRATQHRYTPKSKPAGHHWHFFVIAISEAIISYRER